MISSEAAATAFASAFSTQPSDFAFAPGRVNLIGEHTDYNDGFVLPAAIDAGITVACRPRVDRLIRAASERLGGVLELRLDGSFRPRRDWTDYVVGVARLLERTTGVTLGGADLFVAGDLPIGAGLSSSAALEISVALALSAAAEKDDPPCDRLTLARLAQQAEHEYAGTRCGLMDQLAVVFGKRDHALLIDCRSADLRPVHLPEELQIVVCDSGVRRELARSEYNRRRDECTDASRRLATLLNRPMDALRDVTPADLESVGESLPPLLHKRARHVVTENGRVLDVVEALQSGDLDRLATLMVASHASLRDDYEVSAPELDALVEAASQVAGCWGTRLTGAGFGGCTVNLVEAAAVDDFQRVVRTAYQQRFDRRPAIHRYTASDGARVVTEP